MAHGENSGQAFTIIKILRMTGAPNAIIPEIQIRSENFNNRTFISLDM
jgi:hypothetical protein